MVELQAFAALAALERVRERAVAHRERMRLQPALTLASGMAFGWVAHMTARRRGR